jgi:hypothetical protein
MEAGQPGRGRKDEADAHAGHRECAQQPGRDVVGAPEAVREREQDDAARDEQHADVCLLVEVLRRQDEVDGADHGQGGGGGAAEGLGHGMDGSQARSARRQACVRVR